MSPKCWIYSVTNKVFPTDTVPDVVIVVASNPATTKSAASYPVPPILTVVVGSTVTPLNNLNLLLSDASLNNPRYLVVPSLYFP
mgnify:CR=1 FL=1